MYSWCVTSVHETWSALMHSHSFVIHLECSTGSVGERTMAQVLECIKAPFKTLETQRFSPCRPLLFDFQWRPWQFLAFWWRRSVWKPRVAAGPNNGWQWQGRLRCVHGRAQLWNATWFYLPKQAYLCIVFHIYSRCFSIGVRLISITSRDAPCSDDDTFRREAGHVTWPSHRRACVWFPLTS